MYPITEKMKSLFDEKQRQTVSINVQLKEGSVGEDFIATEADIVSGSFSLDRYCATGENIEIGSAVAAEVKFILDNSKGKFDNISLGGAKLFVRLGIKDWNDEEGSMHYMDCGYFTVDENPKPLTKISVAALDNMMRFDRKVNWNNFSFPMSIENIVSVCCADCGVTLSPSVAFSDIPNGAYEVQNIPSTIDITYRTLIQWAAEITGTCAFADWNGHLRLSWCESTDVHIDTSNRYTSETDESITVTGVQIVDSDNAVHLYGEEGYVLNIEGNELIQNNKSEIAANLGAVLCGFTYVPFECSCFPMPYLYPMDIVSFTDIKGNTFDTMVTAHVYTLNGTSSLKGAGENTEQQNYSSSSPFTKREATIINNLKKSAEKTMNRIEQGTVDMNNALLNALGLYPTTVKNDDGSSIYYFHSKETLEECVEGDLIFCLNAGGFGVCTTGWNEGNPTFTDGYDAKSGRAIWQYLCANTISASLIKAGRLESNDGSTYFDLDGNVIGVNKQIEVTEEDENGETVVTGYTDLYKSQFTPYGHEVGVDKTASNNLDEITEVEEFLIDLAVTRAGYSGLPGRMISALIKGAWKILKKGTIGYSVSGVDADGILHRGYLTDDDVRFSQTYIKYDEAEETNKAITEETFYGKNGIKSDLPFNIDAPEIILNGCHMGNKLLWSGAELMDVKNVGITLSAPVSEQPTGIVLVFSPADSGDVLNYHYCSFFVSKYEVANLKHNDSNRHNFPLFQSPTPFSYAAIKYLYITDNKITGNEYNSQSGTGGCGIIYDNSRWCLRAVIGV